MIQDALRAKYPDITVIGTVGPFPEGEDYDKGWKIADEFKVQAVDEHYYEPPSWFLSHLMRYDGYDRSRAKVYLGEYASKGSAFGNALAEAAYMSHLERNGDVVQLASYAPLLARLGHTQWNPDLIYFNGTSVFPSVNYQVQKLFSTNAGDRYLTTTVTRTPEAGGGEALTCSSVVDSWSGDLILKVTNVSPTPVSAAIRIEGGPGYSPQAALTVLAGDPKAVNNQANASPILPQTSTLQVSANFPYPAPANSLSILRLKPAGR